MVSVNLWALREGMIPRLFGCVIIELELCGTVLIPSIFCWVQRSAALWMNFDMIFYISLDVNKKLNVNFSSNKTSFVKKKKVS